MHQGFVEVSDDKVTILSDVCELADEIDVARAQASAAVATDALRSMPRTWPRKRRCKRAEHPPRGGRGQVDPDPRRLTLTRAPARPRSSLVVNCP